MSTISTTKNFGIELGISYPSPLTITSTGYINGGTSGFNGAAVYAAAAQTLALYNFGTIRAAGTAQGVHEGSDQGLSITNKGTITAASNAVYLQSSGPIYNSGTITSTASDAVGSADAVQITNTSTGLISGFSSGLNTDGVTLGNSGTITATSVSGYGLELQGGASTVTNSGTIVSPVGIKFSGSANQTIIDSGTIGGTGTSQSAISFSSGNDLLKFTPSASVKIEGTVNGGGGTNTLEFTSAASQGTLTGVGADFVNFAQGTIVSGANWVLAGTNTIDSTTTLTNSGSFVETGTLTNAGKITGALPSTQSVMTLGAGAYVKNVAGGAITAAANAEIIGYVVSAARTVNNAGSIGNTSTAAYAVFLQGTIADQLINSGTITTGSGAVYISDGSASNSGRIAGGSNSYALGIGTGYLHNSATGSINGVFVVNGSIVNDGTITNSDIFAIRLLNSGTVIDSGKISGDGSTAIKFGGAGNSLLKLYPGATITNGDVSANGSGNVLELASSASQGTISHLSTGYLGFKTTTVDSGSQWKLGGTNTLKSGYTLTNAGTLTVPQYLLDKGAFTNTGSLIGAGTIGVDPTTFTNSGYDSLAVNLSGGSELDNTSTGTVNVTGFAVSGDLTPETVVNAGSIAGNGPSGIGVNLLGGGNVANGTTADVSASVTGYLVGLNLLGTDTVTNFGTMAATSTAGTGVYIYTGTLTNGGPTSTAALIEGEAYALEFGQGGAVTNYGTILATGTSGIGLLLGFGGQVTNGSSLSRTALIEGATGILAAGAAVAIQTYGTIEGTGTAGVGISLQNSSVVIEGSNGSSAGLISGTQTGIALNGSYATTLYIYGVVTGAAGITQSTGSASGTATQTIVDSGTIIGTAGTAVQLNAGADLLQLRPGNLDIQGTVAGGGGSDTLELASATSTGTLTGVGADFTGFSTLEIDSGASWVLAGANTFASGTTLTNSGTLVDTGALTGKIALASSAALLSVASTGLVTNSGSGPLIGGTAGTVINDGSLAGVSGAAVSINGGGSVLNRGNISAAASSTVYLPTGTVTNLGTISNTDTLGFAVDSNLGNVVINGASNVTSALITGAHLGVNTGNSGAAGTVVNYGTIIGGNFFGVRLQSDTGTDTLTNRGVILSDSFIGAAVYGHDTAVGSVDNSGTIEATGSGYPALYFRTDGSVTNTGLISGAGDGFRVNGNYSVVVTNAGTLGGGTGFFVFNAGTGTSETLIDTGTITGTSGTAAHFGGGTELLQFKPSASVAVAGTVDGGSGTAALEFASAASAGTLTGTGAYFANFSHGTIDSGADWVFAGSNTIGSTTTLTDVGTLVDTGMLTNAGSITGAGTFIVDPATFNNTGYMGITATLTGSGDVLNNGSTGTISVAGLAVYASGASATVLNAGTISNAGGTTGSAVDLKLGGSVNNTGGIAGGANGVTIGSAGTVTNYGTITAAGNHGAAVHLNAGGTVVNGSTIDTAARIAGYQGILAQNAAASITNFGTILSTATAGGVGVDLEGGGTLVNGAAGDTGALVAGGRLGVTGNMFTSTITNYGTITGSDIGIYLVGGGTVIDSGKIVGGGSDAIVFGDGGQNEVVLEHGYSITGGIVGGETANSVVLLGTSSAESVTVTYSNLSLTNFGTVGFAPGAGNYATLMITNTAHLPGTISNFTGSHDVVDLTQLSDAGNNAVTTLNTATNVLTVTGDNGSVQLQLGAGNYSGVGWGVTSDGSGGSDVTPGVGNPPAVTETLGDDTSNGDKISSDPEVTGGGNAGATVTISEGVTTLGTTTASGAGLWSFTPTGLADGSQTLVAKEVNNFGTGTASLTFTLDTTAPAVAITSPATITNQATQTIAGTVSDANLAANATVTLFDNGTQIGTTTESGGSWSTAITLPNQGANAITAEATDLAGNTGTSAADTLTLDTIAPALTITSPGTITNQATQPIAGTVSDANLAANATVALFDNGTQIGTTTESGGSWSTSITLANQGANAITAEATDLAGNTGTSAADTLTLATIAPALTITSPGTITNQATQTITGTVSDANLAANATVTLFDDGTQIGTTTESGGSWSLPITLSVQGIHDVTAQASDLAGNTGTSAADAITYDITPPTLTIDSLLLMPAGGTSTIPGSLLASLDNLSSDAQETYTVTTVPQQGALLVDGAPATTFTQAEIDAGLVTYVEVAPGAMADAFGFTVADAAGNVTGPDRFAFVFASPQPGAQFGFFETPGSGPVNLVYSTDGTNLPAPVSGDFNLEIITQPTQSSYSLPSGYQGVATFPGGTGKALDLIAGDINVIDAGPDDSIAAGPGNGVIIGGQGDTITGGTGATQIINGTQGYEAITGGSAGNETLFGGSGDTVDAGAAAVAIAGYRFDTITGGTGADLTDGTAGDQLITGGSAGTDTIVGGAGDTINGGTGANDTVNAFAGDETIVAGAGNTIVYAGPGDVVEDGSGIAYFTVTGGSNAVAIGLAAGSAIAYAGPGDTLTGGAETATIIGAPGADFVLGAGTDTVNAIPGGEAVTFGTGSALVYGGPGDTFANAAGAAVTFNGGSNAIILSGTGNSAIVYDGAGDTLTGAAAAATVIGAMGDNITLGAGADTVNAFAGNETVTLGSGANETVYGATGDTIDGSGGAPLVTFVSGSQGVIFTETAGADLLNSGPGDTLAIGAGSMDIVGAANNLIALGAGSDTVNALPPDESVTFGTGNATVFGGDGDTIGSASGTNIVLTGGNSAIVVAQTGGAVTVADGAGDTVAAGNAASAIIGASNSAIALGTASDTVTGANGDTITAGAGGDAQISFAGSSEVLDDTTGVYADTLSGFSQPAGDSIHLTTDTVSDALAHATQVNGGADTLITLSDSSTILLKGVASLNSTFFS